MLRTANSPIVPYLSCIRTRPVSKTWDVSTQLAVQMAPEERVAAKPALGKDLRSWVLFRHKFDVMLRVRVVDEAWIEGRVIRLVPEM